MISISCYVFLFLDFIFIFFVFLVGVASNLLFFFVFLVGVAFRRRDIQNVSRSGDLGPIVSFGFFLFFYYFETLLRPDVLKVRSKFLRPVVLPVLNVRLLIPAGTRPIVCPVLQTSFVRS